MNAVPEAHLVDSNAVMRKQANVAWADGLATQLAQGLSALDRALRTVADRPSYINSKNEEGHSGPLIVQRHEGGWTSQVLLFQGTMPFLELRAPDNNATLLRLLGELLASVRDAPNRQPLSRRPDLPSDALYVWLGHD